MTALEVARKINRLWMECLERADTKLPGDKCPTDNAVAELIQQQLQHEVKHTPED